MKCLNTSIKRIIFCKLDDGEDLLDGINKISNEYNIKSASFYGIGAVKKAVFGFYKDNKYISNEKNQNLEVISCIGNIAIDKDTKKKIIHCHITCGDDKGNSFGGHVLTGCIISPTLELTIFEFEDQIFRKYNEKLNLTLLNL
ncbi:MAG: PPC domain-containing DNA-binding protein [Candidatus Helarchaeota archaeon]